MRWAIVDQNGINVEALKAHITEHTGIKTYPHGEYVADGPKVLELECDILIPAALEAVINLGNAARIQALLIIEGANGPVTAGTDKILRDKGTVIIPDMFANEGGVTVSYLEWVKNLSHIRLGRMQRREEEARHRMLISEIERATGTKLADDFKQAYINGADELTLVRSGLDDTMRGAYGQMHELWHSKRQQHDDFDLRTADFILAIEKVANSYRSLGL